MEPGDSGREARPHLSTVLVRQTFVDVVDADHTLRQHWSLD